MKRARLAWPEGETKRLARFGTGRRTPARPRKPASPVVVRSKARQEPESFIQIVPGEDMNAWFTRYVATKPCDDDARHAAGFQWRKWFETSFGSRAAAPFTAEDIETVRRTILRCSRSQEEASSVWALLVEVDTAICLAARTKPIPKGRACGVPHKPALRKPSDERDAVDEAAWVERLKTAWIYK